MKTLIKHLYSKPFLEIILPILTLGGFLFYLVWSVPISILNKAFLIQEYHIFTNFFVLLSVGICILWGIILYILYNRFRTLYNWALGLTYFVIGVSTLYPYIFPYQYGFFEENITLFPNKDPLAFGKIYYLIDLLIFSLMGFLSYISVKKSIKLLPIVLLIFYTIENIKILTTTSISSSGNTSISSSGNTSEQTITFSLNHKNLVLYVHDALDRLGTINTITNIWTTEEKEWTQDFTFYDNVITPSLGTTLTSMPSLSGGYKYSPQYFLSKITKGQITINHPLTKNLIYLKNPVRFFWDQGIQEINTVLDNKVEVSYHNINTSELKSFQDNTSIYRKMIKTPILAVSFYDRIPYFLRFLVVKRKTWRRYLYFDYRWVWFNATTQIMLNFKKTSKPTINIIHSFGIHTPSFYPNSTDLSEAKLSSEEKYNKALNYFFDSTRFLIQEFKKNNIYDNSKIIVTTDHGHQHSELAKQQYGALYKKLGVNYAQLDAFFMVKDFKGSSNIFHIDSRPLALPDIHAIMISSFTNLPGYIDYTKTQPPRRLYNILPGGWEFYAYYMDKKNSSRWVKDLHAHFSKLYLTNNSLSYFQVESSHLSTNYKILSHPFDKIEELPPYEIID